MKELICLLEEPSAKEMLTIVCNQIVPKSIETRIIAFEGKRDLASKLVKRIQLWQNPEAVFLVMQDQDGKDCIGVKSELQELINQTGKADRTIIRIACQELESFYFGDLEAVEKGLDIKDLRKYSKKKQYRVPDDIPSPSEALKKITKYKYQKVCGSKAIAPYLKLAQGENSSHSFQVLLQGIQKLIEL